MAGLQDVATTIAKNNSITIGAAKEIILDTLDTIVEMAGESSVRIGKHTFKTAERAARTCRNPHTGEKVEVAAKTIIKYKYAATKIAEPEPAPKAKAKSKKAK